MDHHQNTPLPDEGINKSPNPYTHITHFHKFLPTDPLKNLFTDSLKLNIIGTIFVRNSDGITIPLQKDRKECLWGGILCKEGNMDEDTQLTSIN